MKKAVSLEGSTQGKQVRGTPKHIAKQRPRELALLRFHLNVGLGRDQRQGSLLGILCVDLDDGKARGTGRHGSYHHTEQGTAAADAWRVRLASCGDHHLPFGFIPALDDGNFLIAAGQEGAVLDVFDADDRRIVLQHHGDGIKVVYVIDCDAHGRCLTGSQCEGLRVEAQASVLPRTGSLRRTARLRLRSRRWCDRSGLLLHGRLLRGRLPSRSANVALAADGDVLLGPGRDGPQIAASPARQANDAGCEHDQNVVLSVFHFVVGEQVLHQRDLREAGPAVDRLAVGLGEEAAQNVDFAFAQPNVMFDLVLTDDGLLNATDRRGASDLRDFEGDFQADFMVGVDSGRDVYVDANIDVGELRVDQWIDRSGTYSDASLKAARRDWDAAADVEFGRLAVNRLDLRVLDDVGHRVGQNEISCGAGQRHRVIRIQITEIQLVQGNSRTTAGRASSSTVVSRAGIRREGDRSRLARQDAEVAKAIRAGRQDFDLHHDFGFGFINIFQKSPGDR